jgi:hypothetical protein
MFAKIGQNGTTNLWKIIYCPNCNHWVTITNTYLQKVYFAWVFPNSGNFGKIHLKLLNLVFFNK